MTNLPRNQRTAARGDQERHLRIRQIAVRVWLGRSADPDIEIDADASVSIAADGSGAWVQAWLWVDGEQLAEGSP
jgi:hypothetical protein